MNLALNTGTAKLVHLAGGVISRYQRWKRTQDLFLCLWVIHVQITLNISVSEPYVLQIIAVGTITPNTANLWPDLLF